ncbi:MAG: hypothetical protein QG673_1440 [Pseudomonadota bacterium]|nr:hypothetical protein [Pseudomonadota bacterium]
MVSFLSIEQQKLRDSILGINNASYLYGVSNFDNLNLTQLSKLIENDFIQLDDSFNDAPNVQVFFDFMTKYSIFKCFGFSTRRKNDYCVVISGIEGRDIDDKHAIIEFSNNFRLADEFHVSLDYCRAWYD